jgi:hypothetical protein
LGLLNGEKILKNVVDSFTEENRIVLFVIVQNSQKPTHVVLVHRLVLNLLTCTRHSQRMLKTGLFPVFAESAAEDLLVELDGPRDGVVVPEIETVLFAQLF